jgi:hypothetical protein
VKSIGSEECKPSAKSVRTIVWRMISHDVERTLGQKPLLDCCNLKLQGPIWRSVATSEIFDRMLSSRWVVFLLQK